MTNKSRRGIRSTMAKKFSSGILGFGVLVTMLLLIAFDLMVVFSRFYSLVFLALVLAGFIIGYYSKGGKVGFIGVCVTAMIILLLRLTLILVVSPSFIITLWDMSPIVLISFLLSPVILGILGFVGGFASGLVAKRIQPSRKWSCLHLRLRPKDFFLPATKLLQEKSLMYMKTLTLIEGRCRDSNSDKWLHRPPRCLVTLQRPLGRF